MSSRREGLPIPTTVAEAVKLKAENPDAVPIAGGTDLMVELNFGHREPALLLDLTKVEELGCWRHRGDAVSIGAGVPFTVIIDELGSWVPALCMAGRTVGSRQIRNRATLGGNLATASPAGDGLPPLIAGGALIDLVSLRGRRTVAAREFFTGPKQSLLEPDELIAAVTIPAARGPQQFAKVGTRNAMVIAVAALALELRVPDRSVGVALGSCGPTPLGAPEAEQFVARELDWGGAGPLPDELAREFGALVAAAARPIDDVRGSVRYRKHVMEVMARRALGWVWEQFRTQRMAT